MDVGSALGLIGVVVLVLLNGFFVATEFAIVAVRRSRIDQLAREGKATAQVAQKVVDRLDAYIAACQLGITLASLALGWIGEPALAHLIEPPLEALVGQFAPAAAHAVSVAVSFTLITALHIVIGELAPKGLALQRTEATTLWVARPIHYFYIIFRWPITVLNAIGNGVLRLAGLEPAAGHEMAHSAEELRLLLTSSLHAGQVEKSEALIASRAIEFADLTAGSLMTPRVELEAIPITASLAEIIERVEQGTHTRLLVYRESLDDIAGLLRVRDLFRIMRDPAADFDLAALLRPVLTVPESKKADELLEEFRHARRPLAVVIDEYGGTAGVVTLEDLAEALIGRIDREAAAGDEATPEIAYHPESDGTMIVDGLMRLHELEEVTGLEIKSSNYGNVETVSGLIMYVVGRIPAEGDEVPLQGWTLCIEQMDGRRVAKIRLLPDSAAGPEEEMAVVAADRGEADGPAT